MKPIHEHDITNIEISLDGSPYKPLDLDEEFKRRVYDAGAGERFSYRPFTPSDAKALKKRHAKQRASAQAARKARRRSR